MMTEDITKAFETILGMPPRQCDIAVIQMLGNSSEDLADYIWNHFLGKSENPSYEDVLQVIQKLGENES